mgnify:CR=1 FL=1
MRILLNRHSPSGCCRYPIKGEAGDEQAEGGMILGEIYDVAEAKGREAERAAIVAWLRKEGCEYLPMSAVRLANAIERGDHLPGGGE